MPELPEVEAMRKALRPGLRHEKIRMVNISDTRIFRRQDPAAFRQALPGHSIEDTGRYGKYFLLRLDDDRTVAMHFGLTGSLRYYASNDAAPGNVCATIELGNNRTLAYVSRRKLGTMQLIDDVGELVVSHGLGPDALSADFSEDHFVSALRGRRGSLKAALMNQQIMAGIGNVYSDEILFQERLHPAVTLAEIDDDRLRRLYRTMRHILALAAEAPERQKMPESLLTRHRQGEKRCPRCDGALQSIKAAGRSSLFCPACQPR